VSGKPAPNDDEDSSPVSDDSSSAEHTQAPSRRRLGRGYRARPKTERLTSAPRGQFVSRRSQRTEEFQTKKYSSLIARDYHAVDATVVDIVDRKCSVTHITQPASVASMAGTSAVLRGSNSQLTEAANVDQSDCFPFGVITYRQKYCTWPLDARSTADLPGVDGDTDAKSFVSRQFNVGRLQRQDAVDMRPPSTVEVDQLSRPSAASTSRSTGNVSIDKPEIEICDRQTGSDSEASVAAAAAARAATNRRGGRRFTRRKTRTHRRDSVGGQPAINFRCTRDPVAPTHDGDGVLALRHVALRPQRPSHRGRATATQTAEEKGESSA